MLASDLYGKEIITNSGNKLGYVEDMIFNMEEGSIDSLTLIKLSDLSKGENIGEKLRKNTVKYSRVKSVSESIIVGMEHLK
jgi:sporulation protein YlmC with PRC-barrel domain